MDQSYFLSVIEKNVHQPVAQLFIQIFIIICVAKLLGYAFKKLNQPSVLGEILAGILLGPSLFGHFFPAASQAIFPVPSLMNIQILAQLGLIFFIFIVGLQLNTSLIRNKAKEVAIIGNFNIITPFVSGILLAFYLYADFAPKGVSFVSFALFIGISMCITALPVLVRIMQEKPQFTAHLSDLIVACAATDDLIAWCLLAIIIGFVKTGTLISAIYTILFAIVFLIFMLKILKPWLNKIAIKNNNTLSAGFMSLLFLVLITSTLITNVLGLHALFGALIAGITMPKNEALRTQLIHKIEDLTIVILLPLFFVINGLRTEIGLIDSPKLIIITAFITFVAVFGKIVGSAIPAKIVGFNWKDSFTMGVLMNTRGLMELVVLNIGFEMGIFTKELFTMFVFMALITTFMTSPLLHFVHFLFQPKKSGETGN